MMKKFALATLAAAALSGCSSPSFAWRSTLYELPEEALDAQRRELEQEVGGVTPVLEEERLGGRALLALPNLRGLKQALRPGAVEDEEGRLHYEVGLIRGELRALAQALVRSGLFEQAEVVEEELPGAVPAPAGASWRVVASPHPGYRQVQWSIEAVGAGQVGFEAPPAAEGPSRFDAFVQAASTAGQTARGGEASASHTPAGWAPFTLPPEGGAERVQVAVPVAPKVEVLIDNASVRSWVMTCETRDLQLGLVYDHFAPNVDVVRGLEASMRDRLRDDLPARVLSEEDPGGVEKWAQLMMDDGRVVVARIRQAGRGLAAAVVIGAQRDVFAPGAETGALRDRLTVKARAYLDSLELTGGS